MMENLRCGFIMPISPIGDYSAEHWEYIKNILISITTEVGFENSEIVSYDEINPDIKSRIVNHLFNISIVICDVSGNNPNVLYELGLRVGFDMPIVIIKDKRTAFNFDLNSFEHVLYPDNIEDLAPKDPQMLAFTNKLELRLRSILTASQHNSPVLSPLRNYLDAESYLKIKRGVPFDIEGSYEYICYRQDVGYSHGGLCTIRQTNSFGNLIEWQLKGLRCWVKSGSKSKVQKFEFPYPWETKKAVIFPDRAFMLNYKIKAQNGNNIIGIINGEVHLQDGSNQVEFFTGDYNQDDGSTLTMGGFRMEKVEQGVKHETHKFKFQKIN